MLKLDSSGLRRGERGDSKYNYSFHELYSDDDVSGGSSGNIRGRRKRRH